ncbi:response regulator [Candidatus Korobacter versatilis]|nr:response regulator [Candidatus Koribacter versatilis]
MNRWAMEERPILIVEDNPRERELIASALIGYELSGNVMSMSCGAELLDYIARRGSYHSRRTVPSLVILDLDLEDMHGLELLRAIRHDREMGAVPVVIFSGSDSALDAAVARELRADGFVVKPTDFHDLQTTVRSLAVFWASQVRKTAPTGTSNND